MSYQERIENLLQNPSLGKEQIKISKENVYAQYSNCAGTALYVLKLYNHSRPLYFCPDKMSDLLFFNFSPHSDGELIAFKYRGERTYTHYGVIIDNEHIFMQANPRTIFEKKNIEEYIAEKNEEFKSNIMFQRFKPNKPLNIEIKNNLVNIIKDQH